MQLEPPRHQDTKRIEPISAQLDDLARAVVDAAFKVHTELGPGLLESVYEICLAHELRKRRLRVEVQVARPIFFDGIPIDSGLRIDMVVENELLIELKSTEAHNTLYEAQLLTYLKLANKRLGLLINFNVPRIRDGIKRIAL
ncbi:MAG TPA: GxxExxY protein [Verrucomicrobiae bacterium]|jgi:GxxExxY protein